MKEEEDGDSSGKDSDDESEEDAEVTEASAGKIGVLLSDDDEDAKIDSEEITCRCEECRRRSCASDFPDSGIY